MTPVSSLNDVFRFLQLRETTGAQVSAAGLDHESELARSLTKAGSVGARTEIAKAALERWRERR